VCSDGIQFNLSGFKKVSISSCSIQVLCFQDLIPGAARMGYVWAISKDAEKPVDAWIKSGKYIKNP
jgi:hypothetical protein